MRTLLLLLSFLLHLTIIHGQTRLSMDNLVKRPIRFSGTQQLPTQQRLTPVSRNEKCGFTYLLNKAKAKGFNDEAYESQMRQLIQKRAADQNRLQAIVTVPVIFHIIHFGDAEGGDENISQARVNAQIDQLNADFGNASGSSYGVAADVEIRFCAALVDPYGRTLTQPGIERINGASLGWTDTKTFVSPDDYVSYIDGVIKPASIWDPPSYVNIWTAAKDPGVDILGYATFPGFSSLPDLSNAETDESAGVVVIPGSVGSLTVNGTEANYDLGRTLTHEMGHFFGLRHIWGDASCGTDFCADTPTQLDETGGCPGSTLPTGCAPGNRMFENYMDYTDDACMNTFTADQGLRIATVMANSPRRITLPASAACTPRAANSIQFPLFTYSLTENEPAGACPRTKVINISLGIAGAATDGATVTFTLGGSATNNGDYTISPAAVTYTNGDNALKQITITINDDNTAEPLETIVLGYTISGAGVTAGPDRQTFTINILNDDFESPVDNTTPTVTLLNENFNGSANIPAGWNSIMFGSTNGWVVSANGGNGTTGNAAHITDDPIGKPNTYNKDEFAESYLVTPLIDATGLTNISISFNWRCIGEVDFDRGVIGFIPESDPASVFLFPVPFEGQLGPDPAAENFSAILPAFFNNSRFWFVFNWQNDDITGDDPPFTIDDVVIDAQSITVESTLNEQAELFQSSGQSAQYITTDREIIARVNNLSENVGCITATVQNAGTGLTTITTSSGSFFRSNKVIRLEPGTANTTSTYQVTLYYTTAEMAAWGGSVSSLKMIKVRDGVSLASTITPADAVLVTPTIDDQRGTRGYVAFTGSFTGGFSQFTVVSPTTTLPVDLLVFEAKPAGRAVLLNWSTAQEQNNKGFGIERSTNGTDYRNIGWINGQANSNSRSDYRFTDNFVQPGVTYSYRLRQTDFDNREKLSVIRQARLEKSGIAFMLNPNPARGRVSLFISGSTSLATISLLNAQGQLVRSWHQVNAADTPLSLDINGLAKGLYMISIRLPEETRVEKLIIE